VPSFWERRAPQDELNDRIWRESTSLQEEIQSLEDARDRGVGAQQAMLLPDRALPWVPDLLGEDWRSTEAILVVGSAYSPFVTGAAGRACTMAVDEYASASTWQEFQSAFVSGVVERDPNYYGYLKVLARATPEPNGTSHLGFLDLCRASFARRIDHRFQGGDKVVRDSCDLYERYVEHPKAQAWTWERLTASNSERIVAMGSIAEHGLLRLFASRGCSVWIGDELQRIRVSRGGRWVTGYALNKCTLTSWTLKGQWWSIAGAVENKPRTWYVLPVLHPSRASGGYDREIELLSLMRA
jgi:hypothetical protein